MSLLPKRRIKNPATPEEIATTNRNAAIIGTGLSLLIPGGFFAGIGRKAIGQAFRKAGTAGNRKAADTVGNRIKQTQAIMGTNRIGSLMHFGGRKTYRTIQKAVEQGPVKFFSKGRHPKTGVTAGKRTPVIPSKGNVRSMYYQRDMKNPYSDLRVLYRQGARGGTSKGSLLRYNDPYSLRKYKKYAPKNFDNIPDDI